MKKLLISSILLIASLQVSYAEVPDIEVFDASVTAVRVYETAEGSTSGVISLNGNYQVGPNPEHPETNCELWSHNSNVIKAALQAKATNASVHVAYVNNGSNPAFCKVRFFVVR